MLLLSLAGAVLLSSALLAIALSLAALLPPRTGRGDTRWGGGGRSAVPRRWRRRRVTWVGGMRGSAPLGPPPAETLEGSAERLAEARARSARLGASGDSPDVARGPA